MEQKMDRRTFLKISAAGAGAVGAAAFVPAKWVKPVIRAGVLPVHAQASSNPIVLVWAGGENWAMGIQFTDPLGKVSESSWVFISTLPFSTAAEVPSSNIRVIRDIWISSGTYGNGFAGGFVLLLYWLGWSSGYYIAIADTAAGDRMSNRLLAPMHIAF